MQLRAPFVVGVVASVTMVVAVGYGMASGGFVDGLETVIEEPWGRVTLVDLGAGLLLAGAWIGWREQSISRAIPWWIAMVLTGNLATGVYVVWASWRSGTMQQFLLGDR
jgi:hypothetical protein